MLESIEQTIERRLPFLFGIVGAGRDFFADAGHEFHANRFCVLFAFLRELIDWRSVDWLVGWCGQALPPSRGPAHGTLQLIGAVFVHRVLSPGVLVRFEDMAQVPQVYHKARCRGEATGTAEMSCITVRDFGATFGCAERVKSTITFTSPFRHIQKLLQNHAR